MNREEFASNSNKSKALKQEAAEEKRKVNKVVNGTVKTRKKSGLRKFADTFISEDVSDVKSYAVKDVLIPYVKKIIWEVLTGGLDIVLNGKNGTYRNTRTNASRASFRDYSGDYNRSRQSSDMSSRNRGGFSCNDIILESRGEAEEVLSQMIEMLAEYDTPVSVAELYALVGETHNHTDCKYGWKDLSSAYVSRCTDGYMLKLPRPVPITD